MQIQIYIMARNAGDVKQFNCSSCYSRRPFACGPASKYLSSLSEISTHGQRVLQSLTLFLPLTVHGQAFLGFLALWQSNRVPFEFSCHRREICWNNEQRLLDASIAFHALPSTIHSSEAVERLSSALGTLASFDLCLTPTWICLWRLLKD